VEEIKRGVANASTESLVKAVEHVNARKIEFQRVCKKLAEQKAVLGKYSENIDGVSGTQYIKLVHQICGNQQGKYTCLSGAL